MELAMLNYLNVNLVTFPEASKVSGLDLSSKMVDYLTNRVGLFIKGIRYSEGRGVFILYPAESFIDYCKQVKKLMAEGFTFPQIKVKLEKEREELSAECNYLRNQYELEKEIRKQLAHADILVKERNEAAHGRPDIVMKDEKGNAVVLIETKMQEIEKELKTYFNEWDGSMPMLNRIREKIDELETLQARERVSKTISQMV